MDEEPHKPLAVAIYARVSMPKQKSIPSQIDLCRKECDRRGIKPRYILTDQGISAKTEDRPGYQRLLDLVGERRIDALIVWKLDRLVRSMRHFVDVTELFSESGVALISLTEQMDTSSPFGRFNTRQVASIAELERELIGERAKLGRYNMACNQRWPNNFPPLGYKLLKGNRIARDDDEAGIVQQIFRWYKNDAPLTEICRRLAKRGVVGRLGKPMNTATIHSMVRNPIYVGRLILMDIEHRRPDLRIVHEATFAAANDRTGRRCSDANADRRRSQAVDNVVDDYLAYLEAAEALYSSSDSGNAPSSA